MGFLKLHCSKNSITSMSKRNGDTKNLSVPIHIVLCHGAIALLEQYYLSLFSE
jgi:hypothetical protein